MFQKKLSILETIFKLDIYYYENSDGEARLFDKK
jgi:hypothetical protein